MEIRILSSEYLKSDQLYIDFCNNKIGSEVEHFSGESYMIDHAPDFPIYLNLKQEERLEHYLLAFNAMIDVYLKTPREAHLESDFWYSLNLLYKRNYLIEQYPGILEDQKQFNNIVLKKFDWENYIYKCVIGAQYVLDNTTTEIERAKYFELIVNNLDVYNYIIKYEIFRNDQFLINILDIIDEYGLSEVLKAKVTGRDDLGKDERVGRRVIFELNKSYPVVLAPTLTKKELEAFFFDHLAEYIKK